MREYKHHRGRRGDLAAIALRSGGALLLLFVLLFLGRAAWDMYQKMVVATQGEEGARSALAELQAQQQDAMTLDDLSTARGQEAEIRQRFALARPGEGEIDIIEQPAASSTVQLAPQSWWQHVLQALFVW